MPVEVRLADWATARVPVPAFSFTTCYLDGRYVLPLRLVSYYWQPALLQCQVQVKRRNGC
ncbi:hypothetical protein SETIT_1G119000v2 [Setaria italica]|uniref:Uncharacterized protein n=1 Tax=Setaria italica TaxID=4555 RepID=A0A368PLK8_SETIT|nr:hypothetical protein SETIT_1G119000v2 [Setaria italica]